MPFIFYKKALLLCTLLMGYTAGAFAFVPDTVICNITLLPESKVEIHGHTNLNTFTCTYCGEMPALQANIQAVAVNGGWELNPDAARLALQVAYFDCGIRQMNMDFRELLRADAHPALRISLQSLDQLQKDLYSATALLEVAGETRQVCLPLAVEQVQDGSVSATGKLKIRLTDFGLEPPSRLMGMVRVKDNIEVIFHLSLRISKRN